MREEVDKLVFYAASITEIMELVPLCPHITSKIIFLIPLKAPKLGEMQTNRYVPSLGVVMEIFIIMISVSKI